MLAQIKIFSFGVIMALVLLGCASAPRPDACASNLSPNIANSCVVAEGTLWRGSKPDSIGAATLVSKGVQTVVNLDLGAELIGSSDHVLLRIDDDLNVVRRVDALVFREQQIDVWLARSTQIEDHHARAYLRHRLETQRG